MRGGSLKGGHVTKDEKGLGDRQHDENRGSITYEETSAKMIA